jgi:acrylyl-CoA reductase (NADPH)
MTFKALVITENSSGKFERSIVQREMDDLPAGEVLIKVQYTSLNYKDALSATGNKGITRQYPHTPGIDAAGIVELSRNSRFATGDSVIVTGHDLGMNTSGGFAEYVRVPGDWVILKPDEYNFREVMTIGTAGFTAAMAVHKLELMGQTPSMGPIVVTGSTGGVGSFAVAILAKAGFEVIAVSGKTNAKEYLTHLGAARIEPREFVDDRSSKGLLKREWAGAIDTAGGNILHTLLRGCRQEGSVVSTGLVDSAMLNTTVFPFILNGVNLLGVGSAETPLATKQIIWQKLGKAWSVADKLQVIGREVTLEELCTTHIDAILQGKVMGRIVAKVSTSA